MTPTAATAEVKGYPLLRAIASREGLDLRVDPPDNLVPPFLAGVPSNGNCVIAHRRRHDIRSDAAGVRA